MPPPSPAAYHTAYFWALVPAACTLLTTATVTGEREPACQEGQMGLETHAAQARTSRLHISARRYTHSHTPLQASVTNFILYFCLCLSFFALLSDAVDLFLLPSLLQMQQLEIVLSTLLLLLLASLSVLFLFFLHPPKSVPPLQPAQSLQYFYTC